MEQSWEITLNLDQWFKGISYLELWQPFCSVEHYHFCKFGKGYYEDQFCEIILNLGQLFRRGCGLKDFYLDLWRSSCSVELNHLCNFERGHHGEHSCKVI